MAIHDEYPPYPDDDETWVDFIPYPEWTERQDILEEDKAWREEEAARLRDRDQVMV